MRSSVAIAVLALVFAVESAGADVDSPALRTSTLFNEFQRTDADTFNLVTRVDRPPATVRFAAECCKICTKGKACGNSCIRRDYECHQPPGCACDG
jgi:hypothetical protein